MTNCVDSCGIGGWSGPLPGDPDNNSILSAVSAFGGIDLSWTYPAVNPHAVAYVNVLRGVTSVFGGATQRAVATGNYHFDVAEPGITYYYWIQIVSSNGTVGAAIGPASAIAKSSVEKTIAELTGIIDKSYLTQALQNELGGIVDNSTAIGLEIQNRTAANSVITGALNQVQTDLGESLTLLQSEVTVRSDQNSALVVAVDAIAAGNSGNSAAVAELKATKIGYSGSAVNSAPYDGDGVTIIYPVATYPAGTYPDYAVDRTRILDKQGVDLWNATPAGAQTPLVWIAGMPLATAIKAVAVMGPDGQYAKLSTAMTAQKDLNGGFKALYTAKVDVNGLVGGFGLYNNGVAVDAAFDVDTFWIGRTTNKVKPFIVNNGIVYINEAAIGKLTANAIDSRSLSIKDADGKTIFSAGNGQSFSDRFGGNTTNLPADNATSGKSLCKPLNQWSLSSQVIATVSDGKIGSEVLRITGSLGYPNAGVFYPIDRTKTYRTRFWARPSADNASGVLYFCLQQFTAANPVMTAGVNGGRAPYKPSGISRTWHISAYGDTWGEYSYTWTAADWQSDMKYVRPDFLDNYPGAAGYWEIQDFTFEEVTEAVTARTVADQALSDATTKAEAARVAAINAAASAADAKVAAAKVISDAYADGVVSIEEQRAINDATAKANAAQAAAVAAAALDATAKANLAATTSTWSGVSGTDKPADNATVGANASNFTGTIGGDNLTYNSSFESNNGLLGTGWSIYNNAGESEPTTAQIVAGRTGGSAQQISWTVAHWNTKGIYGVLCNGEWTPLKTYVVSFWARTTNLSSTSNCFITWNISPASATTLSSPNLTTEWQRYAFRITMGATVEPLGRCHISVSYGAGAGNVQFDDLMVVEGDVLPSYYPSAKEAQDKAITAQTTATNAATSASAATAELSKIADDAYLSRGEKPEVVRRWLEISGEITGIVNQAWSYGLYTADYQTSHDALNTFLSGISPAYNNYDTDSVIDRAAFNLAFNNYYAQRQYVVNDIAAAAKVLANTAQTTAVSAAGVSLVPTGTGMVITGNSAKKASGASNWDAGFYSRDSFTGGASVSFVIDKLDATCVYMVGLNTASDLTDTGYTTLDYAIYIRGTGNTVLRYQSGNGVVLYDPATGLAISSIAATNPLAVGDVMAVQYDGVSIRYLRNGVVLYTEAVNITLPLFVDSSFANVGGSISNLQFSPMTSLNEPSIKNSSIVVGGRNLLLKTETLTATQASSGGNGTISNGVFTSVSNGLENYISYNCIGAIAGNEYTFSAYFLSSGLDKGIAMPVYINGAWSNYTYYATNASAYTQFSKTMLCTVNGELRVALDNYTNTTGSISIKWPKIEVGNKATAWTPAPEDTLNTAITINADGTLGGGAGGGQVTTTGLGINNFRVLTIGGSATTQPSGTLGLYKNGVAVSTPARSYTVHVITRATGVVVSSTTYDVYGSTANATTMAAALNALTNASIVVVCSYDEPMANRLTNGLDAAMYRCGASSSVFGSTEFKGRSAYVLVGIVGCGEGNGAEAYQGSVTNDINAWCDLSFNLQYGNITGVSSTYKPKSLMDYGYTGDFDATKNTTFTGATTPVSPQPGDNWIKTNLVPVETWHYNGSAWTKGSYIPTTLDQVQAGSGTKLSGIATGATANVVTSGTAAPATPANGDIWVDTNAPVTIKSRIAGAWVAGGNVATNLSQVNSAEATKLTNIATGATKNVVSTGLFSARPAGADGDFYYATDTLTLYQKIAGAWVVSSTVGAQSGVNMQDSAGNIIADKTLLNNYTENGITHISRPIGGTLVGLPTQNGAIKIRLPMRMAATMLKFIVDIYEYAGDASGASASYEVSGYDYTDLAWRHVAAKCNATTSSRRTVRFGYDAVGSCIWIGDSGGQWSYPQIKIRDFTAAYSNIAISNWDDNWLLTFDTTAPTGVSFTVTPYNGDVQLGGNVRDSAGGLLADSHVLNTYSLSKSANSILSGAIILGTPYDGGAGMVASVGSDATRMGWDAAGNPRGNPGCGFLSTGIVGWNGSQTTFTLNANTGALSLAGSILAAGLDVGSAGNVRGGQTAYDTGTGFHIGYTAGVGHTLSLGTQGGVGIRWNGSALSIKQAPFTLAALTAWTGTLANNTTATTTRTATPTGGDAPYTYNWTVENDPDTIPFTLTNKTSATVTVSVIGVNNFASATLTCLVFDVNGRVGTTNCTLTKTVGSPP